MKPKNLHIVTQDVPWPADYGGVVSIFNKLKALHKEGIIIHLHCFTQGRKPQQELNKYCKTVTYYRREKKISRFSFRLPFIVNSRKNAVLINNLQKDGFPVLLEGIHCTYYLYKAMLGYRKVMVQLHNAEFEYYRQLAKQENNIFKKIFYLFESRLLKKYERSISGKASLLAVSQHDVALYQKHFNAANIQYLPVFIPFTVSAANTGKGCFCLYHGNLSVIENDAAVRWLVKKVFNKAALPLVIAGKNPSKKLQKLVQHYSNACIVVDPTEIEMQDLISKAQVHILPSFNNTGIKLKILNALFNGRHCLVNPAAVKGTVLENYCHIATDEISFLEKLKELYEIDFTHQDVQKRQDLLDHKFNNEANAKKLITMLFDA